MNKPKSLYGRGMRPYVRVKKGEKWGAWQQAGIGVGWEESPLLEEYEVGFGLKSLRFEYDFEQGI